MLRCHPTALPQGSPGSPPLLLPTDRNITYTQNLHRCVEGTSPSCGSTCLAQPKFCLLHTRTAIIRRKRSFPWRCHANTLSSAPLRVRCGVALCPGMPLLRELSSWRATPNPKWHTTHATVVLGNLRLGVKRTSFRRNTPPGPKPLQ